jgi:APA family basic amino acid/polyamine antiporter
MYMERNSQEILVNTNKKILTLTDLILMGLANIVGAGIFVIIGKSTKYGGNRTILGILLMAVISMIAGACYIEIYSRFQSNITEYLSVKHALGESSGQFMIMLTYLLAIFSTVTMVIANSKYITSFKWLSSFKDSKLAQKCISLFLLCVMSLINYLGINTSKNVSNTITITMVLLLGGIVLMSQRHITFKSLQAVPPVQWDSFVLSAVLSLFLFNGYDFLVKISDESVNPENNKIALMASISITAIIYIAIIVSSICVIGFKNSCSADSITKMYEILVSPTASTLVNAIAAFIMFNATFLALLSSTRFVYGLGKENKIPFSDFFSQNNSFNAPTNAIYVSLIIASLLAIINNEVVMAVLSNLICILILIILSVTVLIMRYNEIGDKKAQDEHNYIKGNINNIPVLVVVNINILIYVLYTMFKNKFWIKKIYT